MKKRSLALLLVGLVSLGVFSGCSVTENVTTSSGNDAKVVEETTEAQVQEETEAQEEAQVQGSVAEDSSTEAESNEKKSYDGLTIRLGGCDFAIWNPQVNIAFHEGLFEKEFGPDGITVESFNFANGPAGNEAFAAGELDLFNGTGDQPFITAVANNVPVVLLSTTDEAGKDSYIIVREDSAINEPQDLAGKKIGLYIGTQQHKTWLQYLAGHDIDVDDVEIVNLQNFQEQYAAFGKGEIDAFYLSKYNLDQITEAGDKVRIIDNLADYPSRCFITGREGFIEEYPELVERFFKVLFEAQEFIDQNPEKSYEYLAEDAGLTIEEVKTTVDSYDLFLKLDDSVISGVNDTYTFLRDQGILETEIDDLNSHLEPSFVTNAAK